MPAIVNHASPWAHVIQGLSHGAGDTADAIAEKKQQDAYLAAAAQRLASQRAEEERRASDFEYERGRRPLVDKQNDALADLRQRGLGAEVKVKEAEAARIGASDPADALDLQSFDSELESMLAGLPDSPELQAIRKNAGNRRGVLEHYGVEETDPARRRSLRGNLRGQMLGITRNETMPLVKAHAEQAISKAMAMGSLKNNPAAQEALPGLIAALKQPGADPYAILKDFNDLSTSVRTTSKTLAAKEYVYGKLDHFASGLSDDDALEMQDIMSDLEHDAISPQEALKKGRMLGAGFKEDPYKKAETERRDREIDVGIREKAVARADAKFEEQKGTVKPGDPNFQPWESIFAREYKILGGRGEQERKEFAGHGMDPFKNQAPGAAPINAGPQPAPLNTGGPSVVTPQEYNTAFDYYSQLVSDGMSAEKAKAKVKAALEEHKNPKAHSTVPQAKDEDLLPADVHAAMFPQKR